MPNYWVASISGLSTCRDDVHVIAENWLSNDTYFVYLPSSVNFENLSAAETPDYDVWQKKGLLKVDGWTGKI
jgi:hypothetical protein